MSCLSPETVIAFVEGQLPEGQARDVDEHIDACSSCRALVSELAKAAPVEPASSEPSLPELEPLTASTIGPGDMLAKRFCIRRRIGRGAMGLVCEAEDRELGVRVALKVLRREAAASPRLLERLRTEAVLGRRITHPNVCRLYDFGFSDNMAFLSMELLEGETLAARLARGPLEEEDALAILSQICHALEAAHEHDVIHRDLKPSNIMVASDGKVSVMDFGLARDLVADASESGLAIGTPAYWSPEQARGQKATARSDIYSLGLIAYELFGGRKPGTAAEPDLANVPQRHHTLLERCLASEPDARFASVLETREAMKAAQTQTTRRPPFWRGRRFAFGVAAVALLAALLVSVRRGAEEVPLRAVPSLAATVARAMSWLAPSAVRPEPARAEPPSAATVQQSGATAAAAVKPPYDAADHTTRPGRTSPGQDASAAASAVPLPFFE